jgi:hypothetical protein
MNSKQNVEAIMKSIEKSMIEGFELQSRFENGLSLSPQEQEKFEKICHLLERTKKYYDGTWVTFDKQKYQVYKFYLFKPHPERNYKEAGNLEPYGLYNPITKTVDTAVDPPTLPIQASWPWS